MNKSFNQDKRLILKTQNWLVHQNSIIPNKKFYNNHLNSVYET